MKQCINCTYKNICDVMFTDKSIVFNTDQCLYTSSPEHKIVLLAKQLNIIKKDIDDNSFLISKEDIETEITKICSEIDIEPIFQDTNNPEIGGVEFKGKTPEAEKLLQQLNEQFFKQTFNFPHETIDIILSKLEDIFVELKIVPSTIGFSVTDGKCRTEVNYDVTNEDVQVEIIMENDEKVKE